MITDIKKLLKTNNNMSDGVLIKSDINEYIIKLTKNAIIIPYYSESDLKGFIAYCANDLSRQDGYLSMIIIDKTARGDGLGKLMLQTSIFDLIKRGFVNYKLEVLKLNTNALKLYENFGFVIEEDRGDKWLMNLKLNNYL
jgi:ribosomal protein S18 acetylase RimI-like enzyme